MTDKYIPASKLVSLPTYQQDWRGDIEPSRGDNVPHWIRWSDLDNLIDEAPEVEPIAKVLCIIDEDGELEPHTFYSNDEAPSQEELKNKFVIFDVWLSPSPNTDLTTLIAAIESDTHAATFQSMAQYRKWLMDLAKGVGEMSEKIYTAADSLLVQQQETIRTQQATIDRLTEQLNAAAEENAKLVSDKYPFAHIRIDCSEYERDRAIRNKLIELGWTPPAEIEAGK